MGRRQSSVGVNQQIIELKKRIQELKKAEQINEALFEISNAVNTTRNLDDLYLSIHQSLNRLIKVPNLYISLYAPEAGLLHFPYFADEVDTNRDDWVDRQFNEDTLTGEVIIQKVPTLLNEKQLEERQKKGQIVGSCPKIWIGVPLITDETVIGVVAIQSYTDPNAYTRKDMELFISVSHQIALAIERKRVNEALKENMDRYRTLSENSNDVIIRFDSSLIHLYVNPAVHILGQTQDEMMGKRFEDLGFPRDLTLKWNSAVQTVFKNRKVHRVELQFPQGTWIDWLLCPEFDSRSRVISVISFARDITEKKQMDFHTNCYEKINKEIINATDIENMLNAILDTMMDVFDCDRAWIIFPCNPEAASYSTPFMRARKQWHLDPGYDIEITPETKIILGEVLASKDPLVYDSVSKKTIRDHVRKTYFVRSQMVMAVFPQMGDAWEVGLHQCSHDRIWTIEEQHLFKGICLRIADGISNMVFLRELKLAKNYIDNVIDSMPSILMGIDADKKVTHWNKQAHKITGIRSREAVGKPFNHLFPHLKQYADVVNTAIHQKEVVEKLRIPKQIDDKYFFENITIYPLTVDGGGGAVIRIDDVTTQVQMDETMIQSEKMMSVGGLAAGMAHEINNPLAGVIQNANVLINRLSDKHIPANIKAAASAGTSMDAVHEFMENRKILPMLKAIKASGGRMASIIEDMLDFARKGDYSFSHHAPAVLLDKVLNLAASGYDLKKHYDFKAITIVKKYEDNLPWLACEGSKIQQVLLNILNNGAYAMFEKLEYETDYSPRFILRICYEPVSHMVRIEIEDNGPGIDNATCKRIFEPFFTTKPVGVGTGLGLSVSYFILTENHNGTLDVESESGKGTNFIIRLPRDGHREKPTQGMKYRSS